MAWAAVEQWDRLDRVRTVRRCAEVRSDRGGAFGFDCRVLVDPALDPGSPSGRGPPKSPWGRSPHTRALRTGTYRSRARNLSDSGTASGAERRPACRFAITRAGGGGAELRGLDGGTWAKRSWSSSPRGGCGRRRRLQRCLQSHPDPSLNPGSPPGEVPPEYLQGLLSGRSPHWRGGPRTPHPEEPLRGRETRTSSQRASEQRRQAALPIITARLDELSRVGVLPGAAQG